MTVAVWVAQKPKKAPSSSALRGHLLPSRPGFPLLFLDCGTMGLLLIVATVERGRSNRSHIQSERGCMGGGCGVWWHPGGNLASVLLNTAVVPGMTLGTTPAHSPCAHHHGRFRVAAVVAQRPSLLEVSAVCEFWLSVQNLCE